MLKKRKTVITRAPKVRQGHGSGFWGFRTPGIDPRGSQVNRRTPRGGYRGSKLMKNVETNQKWTINWATRVQTPKYQNDRRDVGDRSGTVPGARES